MKTSVLFSVSIVLVISATLDSSNAYTDCGEEIDRTRVCNTIPNTVICPQQEVGPRWFYNSDQKTCVKYDGCPPKQDSCITDNNFASQEECLEFCDGVKEKISPWNEWNEPDLCTLPPDEGPCKGSFQRWYYDSETKECKQFIFGGCGGNENQFGSEEECLEVCS